MPRELRPLNFHNEYMSRIRNPHVGDQVEVLWTGKFYSHALREHGTMGFEGQAWWKADIVSRQGNSANPMYFRAHFPGWEARWDEWVTRDMIRWPRPHDDNDTKTGLDRKTRQRSYSAPACSTIRPKDHVEVLLESARVPDVWIEGDVKKVTLDVDGTELYLVTGMKRPRQIWVRRQSIRRLNKRGSHPEGFAQCVPCFPMPGLGGGANGTRGSCAIM